VVSARDALDLILSPWKIMTVFPSILIFVVLYYLRVA
jgi:hypothetical protein